MKHKVFGITVCGVLLAMQVLQAVLWRDDYPFTKWGMYHMLHPFQPYLTFEIDIEGRNDQKDQLIRDTWLLRERIWPLFEIGRLNAPLDKDVSFYAEQVRRGTVAQQEALRMLLLHHLWHPSDLKDIRVEFKAWNKLQYTNTASPDVRQLVYPVAP